NGRLLAAGRSLRDYPTLARAARLSGCELDVVAPARERALFRDLSHVRFLGELGAEVYSRVLSACAAVVVALADKPRSAGQAVVLEAMALGKPAVLTRSPRL